MKKYIKPQTEAVVLSKEALMQDVVAGSVDGQDKHFGQSGKSNRSDDWDDEEDW